MRRSCVCEVPSFRAAARSERPASRRRRTTPSATAAARGSGRRGSSGGVAATPPEEPRRPDPLAAAVAEGVVRLRREAGLSERAAARKLGTSQTQLRRMEDPRYLPSLRSLQRVALAYGYKLSVAFEHEDAVAKRAAPVKEPKPKRAATRGSASPSKGRDR